MHELLIQINFKFKMKKADLDIVVKAYPAKIKAENHHIAAFSKAIASLAKPLACTTLV
jgi:hypothetical protein